MEQSARRRRRDLSARRARRPRSAARGSPGARRRGLRPWSARSSSRASAGRASCSPATSWQRRPLGDLEVLWIPSYGPEMRGGTAACTVIVSDEPIGSPVVDRADAAVVMNPPSLARFAPTVREGGLLVVNGSLIEASSGRTGPRRAAPAMHRAGPPERRRSTGQRRRARRARRAPGAPRSAFDRGGHPPRRRRQAPAGRGSGRRRLPGGSRGRR